MEEDIKELEEIIKKYRNDNVNMLDLDSNDLFKRLILKEEQVQLLENLIKGHRELEENIYGYQEEVAYQSKIIMELEEQIQYYANEIKEIANQLEKDGFVGYADEIRDLCILQDELMEDK